MRPREAPVTSRAPASSRNMPRIWVPVEPIGLPRTSSSPRPRYPPWAPPSTSARPTATTRARCGTGRTAAGRSAPPSARRRRRRPPAARRRSRRRARGAVADRLADVAAVPADVQHRAMNRPNASSPRPISSGCWCAGAAAALRRVRFLTRDGVFGRGLAGRFFRAHEARLRRPVRPTLPGLSERARAARPAAGRTRRRRCPRRRVRSHPSRRARAGRRSSDRDRARRRSRPSLRRGISVSTIPGLNACAIATASWIGEPSQPYDCLWKRP